MSGLLRKKPMPLPMIALLVASALLIVAALLWALSSRKQADEAVASVEPWQAALSQVQDRLQIEREALQALSQTVSGLQVTIKDIHARIDSQSAEQAVLSEALQTAQQLAQRAQTAASAGEERFGTLQAQLALLEQRIQAAKPTPVAAKPVAGRPAAKPAPLIPPFRVLDVETRGGESFLAIAPAGSRMLTDIRLMREGDNLYGWQLASLSPQRAVFTVGSRQHRVDLRPVLSAN